MINPTSTSTSTSTTAEPPDITALFWLLQKAPMVALSICLCLFSASGIANPNTPDDPGPFMANNYAAAGPYDQEASELGPQLVQWVQVFWPPSWQSDECRMWVPKKKGTNGPQPPGKMPVILWGNGTMADSQTTDTKFQEHLATHGFIVVASHARWTGSGNEIISCLDKALALNDSVGSSVYDKINPEKVCITGHSQGGGGTIMAATDERITCTAPIQPYWRDPFDIENEDQTGYECEAWVSDEGLFASLWDSINNPRQIIDGLWCEAWQVVLKVGLNLYVPKAGLEWLLDKLVNALGRWGDLGIDDLTFRHDVGSHRQQHGPMLLLSGGVDELAWPDWHHEPLFDDQGGEMEINTDLFHLKDDYANHFHVIDFNIENRAGRVRDTYAGPVTAWMYWHLLDDAVAQSYFVNESNTHDALMAFAQHKGRSWTIKKRGDTFDHITKPSLDTAFSTPVNDDGGGNAIYLDRHNVECGNQGIRQFKLKRVNNDFYKYDYTCLDINPGDRVAYQTTQENDDGAGNVLYLDRHSVDCGNYPLLRFQLRRPTNSTINYGYTCGNNRLYEIATHYTQWDSDGLGNAIYLDRHNVACPTGSVMSYMRLENNQNGKIRYRYKCGYPDTRNIRIELTNNYLQLQEVEVKINGQWHFLNSSSFNTEFSARDERSTNQIASKAGDGNKTGNIYHSKGNTNTKWWQASLAHIPGAITNIRIKTRADEWGHRIDGAKVYLSGQRIYTWDWDGAYTKTFAVPYRDRLYTSQSMAPGASLRSSNGKYQLKFKSSGSVVIKNPDGIEIWTTNTDGSGADKFKFQNDGNLVLYSPSGAVWDTNSNGSYRYKLVMQNDGNLVMRNSSGTAVWATGTNGM